MDDVYRQRQDPRGHGRPPAGDRRAGALLGLDDDPVDPAASNLAVAVDPDIDYAVVEAPAGSPHAGTRFVLAEARLAHYARELGGREPVVVRRLKGSELVGLAYTPAVRLLPPAARTPTACSAAGFVTTEDGTGVVHMAPAFGEDDKAACDAAGIDPVVPVDEPGPVHGARCRPTPACRCSRRTSPSSAI